VETKIKYCPINGYPGNLELEGRHAFKFPKEYNDRYIIYYQYFQFFNIICINACLIFFYINKLF